MRKQKTTGFRLVLARTLLIAVLGIFPFSLISSYAATGLLYPPGFRFIEVPDPLSEANPGYPLISKTKPGPGQSWFDLRFGTVQSRVTGGNNLRHEYSRTDPFNCDQSKILLCDLVSGDSRVYRTQSMPYDQPGNLVRTVRLEERASAGEMRWDPSNADLLWCLRDFEIVTLQVETGKISVIKDFSQDPVVGPIINSNPLLYRITNMDEGESSRDKRYWVFALQNGDDPEHPAWSYVFKYLFTWDRLDNKVLGTYQLSLAQGQNLDWVGMSTLGAWVLIGGGPLEEAPAAWGLMMADKELSVFHQLSTDTAHSDIGLDIQGNEVIVMQNTHTDFIDLIPLDLKAKPVNSPDDYNNNIIKPIVRLFYDETSPIGLNSGVHISCNFPGYCLVSTNIRPATAEQNWLDRCNILIRLDRNKARAFYLAKIYNTTGQYWEETHASITSDGKKIVWVDNWGRSFPEPQNPEVTLTQLDMPANWQSHFFPCLVPIHFLLLHGE